MALVYPSAALGSHSHRTQVHPGNARRRAGVLSSMHARACRAGDCLRFRSRRRTTDGKGIVRVYKLKGAGRALALPTGTCVHASGGVQFRCGLPAARAGHIPPDLAGARHPSPATVLHPPRAGTEPIGLDVAPWAARARRGRAAMRAGRRSIPRLTPRARRSSPCVRDSAAAEHPVGAATDVRRWDALVARRGDRLPRPLPRQPAGRGPHAAQATERRRDAGGADVHGV